MDRDHVGGDGLFAGGDEFVKVLDAEADVFSDAGAPNLALPDGVGDPADGDVEVLSGLVNR